MSSDNPNSKSRPMSPAISKDFVVTAVGLLLLLLHVTAAATILGRGSSTNDTNPIIRGD
jgi:hypothetical protein